jgi:hypothetical protein
LQNLTDKPLELYKPGKNDVSTYSFEGTLWVAGGIGFCEPNEWTSWDDRWWNDSWCYTCGAMVSVDYNVGQPNDWDGAMTWNVSKGARQTLRVYTSYAWKARTKNRRLITGGMAW